MLPQPVQDSTNAIAVQGEFEMPARFTVLGMPWFAREHYPAALQVRVDGESLPATFDEWQELAEAAIAQATVEGLVVVRANLIPATFEAWCMQRGFSTGHDCRMAYARDVAIAMYQEGRA